MMEFLPMKHRFWLLCFWLSLAALPATAQEAVVPNITGLNVPQAAAELHKVGLALGAQTSSIWTADSPVPANTIGSQSFAPGDLVAAGVTAIDVTVLRAPNITLRYDDNDFTLINRSGKVMSQLRGLTFAAQETTRPASITIRLWEIAGIDADDCLQVWSIARNQPKNWDGCYTYYWRTTQNPENHFWTQLNGVATFNITLNGVEYGVCPAAAAGSEPQDCNIYLPADGEAEVTEFVEFKYTPTQLVIYNRTPNQWMPLTGLTAGGILVGDAITFESPPAVALINQLAPNQCLLFGEGDPVQPCDVIARAAHVFWTAPFILAGTSTGQEYTCPAATEGKLTICILPR